ncbi:MAG: hypothetical protein HeimC2_36880 [Candidatus Heimdallarchaeota archaeon LC_2]|nr:MAG: hypothetical protein HeimC2_44870 [Candidatus Heimdallarchaeota archaeon LC_2]OLS20530.1 MAG: hypothetical protein HeimC2_36880 [Candidatus Heimdallarchaeota archaeon LC_2]
MQDITKWVVVFVLLIGFISAPSLAKTDFNLLNYNENKSNNIVLNGISYTPHATISIFNTGDFISLGFNGSGTLIDPFMIEGLNITSSSAHLISISNTVAYFTIINNFLKSNNSPDYIGILLENVENAEVSSNVILNVDQGISLSDSKHIKIENNTISNINAAGIEIFGNSVNNLIVNNQISNANDGISIHAPNNQISANKIYQNTIGITHSAVNNIIDGNIVYNNSLVGILLENSISIHIFNNSVYENGAQGIWIGMSNNISISYNKVFKNSPDSAINLWQSTNSIINQNIIFENEEIGILLEGSTEIEIYKNVIYDNVNLGILIVNWETTIFSENNNIIENDFLGNNIGNLVQATDDGFENIFSDNYWHDWDGSGPYNLDGSAINQDPTPSTTAHHISPPILDIQSDFVVSGNLTILWQKADDQYNHSIINDYSLYYSTNNGSPWELIVADLTSLNYTFDTSFVLDGSEISFIIETKDELGFKSAGFSEKTYLVANSIHKLSTPILSAPTGSILNNLVTIEWSHSIDTWSGHTVTYSVHYFAKGGSTWIELASNLTNNFYVWDTKTIVDGSYLLKVVATDSEGNTAENVSVMLFEVVNNIKTIIDPVSSSVFDPTNSSRTENATLPWSNIQIIILSLSVIIMFYRKKRI